MAKEVYLELGRRGWTQKQLAEMAEISEAQLSRFLTFQKDLELSELFRLCEALDLQLVELLERTLEVNGGRHRA